jgi:hypothetical protein
MAVDHVDGLEALELQIHLNPVFVGLGPIGLNADLCHSAVPGWVRFVEILIPFLLRMWQNPTTYLPSIRTYRTATGSTPLCSLGMTGRTALNEHI